MGFFLSFFFNSVQFKCKNMKKTEMLYGRHSHNNRLLCVYTPAAAPDVRQTFLYNKHVLLTSLQLDTTLLCRFSWNVCIYDCISVCIYVHLNVFRLVPTTPLTVRMIILRKLLSLVLSFVTLI